MRTALVSYIATVVIFFALDFAWLSFSANRIYKFHLGSMMLDKPNLPVAACFYLLYVVAVVIFVVLPALDLHSWSHALWTGALLGLCAYGAYDLTNQATLVGWSNIVTVIDMAWGTTATALAGLGGYLITRMLS